MIAVLRLAQGRAVVVDQHDTAVLENNATHVDRRTCPAVRLFLVVTDGALHAGRVDRVADTALVESKTGLGRGSPTGQVRVHDPQCPVPHIALGLVAPGQVRPFARGLVDVQTGGELRDLHQVAFERGGYQERDVRVPGDSGVPELRLRLGDQSQRGG